MYVHILDARQDHASFEIHDLGVRADVCRHAIIRANVDDSSAADSNRFSPGTIGVNRIDAAVPVHGIGAGDWFFTLLATGGRRYDERKQCRNSDGTQCGFHMLNDSMDR
jgi:hypothetical protein